MKKLLGVILIVATLFAMVSCDYSDDIEKIAEAQKDYSEQLAEISEKLTKEVGEDLLTGTWTAKWTTKHPGWIDLDDDYTEDEIDLLSGKYDLYTYEVQIQFFDEETARYSCKITSSDKVPPESQINEYQFQLFDVETVAQKNGTYVITLGGDQELVLDAEKNNLYFQKGDKIGVNYTFKLDAEALPFDLSSIMGYGWTALTDIFSIDNEGVYVGGVEKNDFAIVKFETVEKTAVAPAYVKFTNAEINGKFYVCNPTTFEWSVSVVEE